MDFFFVFSLGDYICCGGKKAIAKQDTQLSCRYFSFLHDLLTFGFNETQYALDAKAQEYAEVRLNLRQITSLLATLHAQQDAAVDAYREGSKLLAQVTAALQHHRDNCLAKMPELLKRAAHTEKDLALLTELRHRIDQVDFISVVVCCGCF